MKPLLVSIPHNGETIVKESYWLLNLNEIILMYDVDRFIDQMYQTAFHQYNIPKVVTPYHRYIVDCNRLLTDVDCDSVEGSQNPSNSHPTGLHWRRTTAGHPLIKKPISQDLHKKIIQKYYNTFFNEIDSVYQKLYQKGAKNIYHLDIHSMPSRGTDIHRDPDTERSDIVIGNIQGNTASTEWTTQIIQAYESEGFSVQLNHPYIGGTVVEKYGQLQKGQQAVMIELNRKLYMNQTSKQIIPQKAEQIKKRLNKVISIIYNALPDIK